MVKLTRYSSIKKRHFNEAMAHLAAMDFFGLRYCLIMDPFVQPQRAVTLILDVCMRAAQKLLVCSFTSTLSLDYHLGTYIMCSISIQYSTYLLLRGNLVGASQPVVQYWKAACANH